MGDVERIQAIRDGAWRASKRGTGQRGSWRASRASAGVAGEAVGPPWRGAEARARASESKGGFHGKEKNRGRGLSG